MFFLIKQLIIEGYQYKGKGRAVNKKLAKTRAAIDFCNFLIKTFQVTRADIWVKDNFKMKFIFLLFEKLNFSQESNQKI